MPEIHTLIPDQHSLRKQPKNVIHQAAVNIANPKAKQLFTITSERGQLSQLTTHQFISNG